MKTLSITDSDLDHCPDLGTDITRLPYLSGIPGVAHQQTFQLPGGNRQYELIVPRSGDIVKFPMFQDPTKVECYISGHLFTGNINGLILPLIALPYTEVKLQFQAHPYNRPLTLTYYQLFERSHLLDADVIVTNDAMVLKADPDSVGGRMVYDIGSPETYLDELHELSAKHYKSILKSK